MIYFMGSPRLFSNIKDCSLGELFDFIDSNEEIAVDTETTGFDIHRERMLSIQFGNYDNQFVVDLNIIPISALEHVFTKDKLWLFQNAKFDLKFLLHQGIKPKRIYDTFLAEKIIMNGLDSEYSLKAIVHKYFNYNLKKEIRGIIHKEGMSERVITYAAEDVKYLIPTKEKQLEQIRKMQLENVLNLENEVVKVFTKMEYDGILIDKDNWTKTSLIAEDNVKKTIQRLNEIVLKEYETNKSLEKFINKYEQLNIFESNYTPININWKSSNQRLTLLNKLGFNTKSTDKNFLYKNKHKHPIIKDLIELSINEKIATSFGLPFLKKINPITKRVHPEINQIINSGRISIKEPNVNQIPSKGELAKSIRASFIAKPGYKIVGADYSSFELCIIAEFSKDEIWINAINNNEDLHSKLCSMTFDIPLSDVKNPFPLKPEWTYRDVQKTINFGLAYGMSEFKLSDTLAISKQEALQIIKKFFTACPKVEQFLNTIGRLGVERNYIRSAPPYGRIRQFPLIEFSNNSWEYKKTIGEIERASKNHPIQSTNADIIKLALINVYNKIEQNNYPVNIIMTVYDEINCECEEEFTIEFKDILTSTMIESAETVIKNVTIKADAKITDYWEK